MPRVISPSTPKPIIEQKRMRRLRPRVEFIGAQVVATVTSRCRLSFEEHHNTWYQVQELNCFKAEIRTVCNRIRNEQHSRDIAETSSTTKSESSDNIVTRGLEQRICKNRQRNKTLAIWGILKAQERNKHPEFIAKIARKCSFTAKELAIAEAARDFCEVYSPEKVEWLSPQIESMQSNPFPVKLKRKNSFESDSGRNARLRAN